MHYRALFGKSNANRVESAVYCFYICAHHSPFGITVVSWWNRSRKLKTRVNNLIFDTSTRANSNQALALTIRAREKVEFWTGRMDSILLFFVNCFVDWKKKINWQRKEIGFAEPKKDHKTTWVTQENRTEQNENRKLQKRFYFLFLFFFGLHFQRNKNKFLSIGATKNKTKIL